MANTSHTDGNLTITVDSPEAFDLLVKIFGSLEARDMYEIYTDLTDQELEKRDDNHFSCSVPFSATSRWSFETGHLDGLLLEELKELRVLPRMILLSGLSTLRQTLETGALILQRLSSIVRMKV